MYANLYGNSTTWQVLYMLQDLKLGQYCKLPPRITFSMQILGTVVGAVLNCTCPSSVPYMRPSCHCADPSSGLPDIMMVTIIDANRPALLSISGTRLWSGQNAQAFNCKVFVVDLE